MGDESLPKYNPINEKYINDTYEKMWDVIFPQEYAAILQGMDEGEGYIKQYKPDAAVGTGIISFDLKNQEAWEKAFIHAGELVKDVTEQMERFIQDVTSSWISSGQPLPELITALEKFYTPERAERIAVTEVTKCFADGNILAWKIESLNVGITGKRWMTAVDEMVCEICGGYDQKVEILFPDSQTGDGFFEDVDSEQIENPPAHPNCRCWVEPVMPYSSDRESLLNPPSTEPTAEPGETIWDQKPWDVPCDVDPLGANYPADQYDAAYNWFQKTQDVNDYSNRGAAKDAIVNTLSQKTGIAYDDVNMFIHQWAMTSNDDDWRALEIQSAVSKIFGTEPSKWQADKIKDFLEYRAKHPNVASGMSKYVSLWEDSAGQLSQRFLALGYKSSDEVTETLVRAMYINTQEQLKAAGIKQVLLYRGIDDYDAYRTISNMIKRGEEVGKGFINMANSAESWALEKRIADGFATSGGITLQMIVPAERVLGTARTGFGCLSEWEWVVLNSTGYRDRIRVSWR